MVKTDQHQINWYRSFANNETKMDQQVCPIPHVFTFLLLQILHLSTTSTHLSAKMQCSPSALGFFSEVSSALTRVDPSRRSSARNCTGSPGESSCILAPTGVQGSACAPCRCRPGPAGSARHFRQERRPAPGDAECCQPRRAVTPPTACWCWKALQCDSRVVEWFNCWTASSWSSSFVARVYPYQSVIQSRLKRKICLVHTEADKLATGHGWSLYGKKRRMRTHSYFGSFCIHFVLDANVISDLERAWLAEQDNVQKCETCPQSIQSSYGVSSVIIPNSEMKGIHVTVSSIVKQIAVMYPKNQSPNFTFRKWEWHLDSNGATSLSWWSKKHSKNKSASMNFTLC